LQDIARAMPDNTGEDRRFRSGRGFQVYSLMTRPYGMAMLKQENPFREKGSGEDHHFISE